MIQPHFDHSLPQLHVEYDSAYGTITADWQQAAHTFTVLMPGNTTASLTLPDGTTAELGSGTHRYAIRQD